MLGMFNSLQDVTQKVRSGSRPVQAATQNTEEAENDGAVAGVTAEEILYNIISDADRSSQVSGLYGGGYSHDKMPGRGQEIDQSSSPQNYGGQMTRSQLEAEYGQDQYLQSTFGSFDNYMAYMGDASGMLGQQNWWNATGVDKRTAGERVSDYEGSGDLAYNGNQSQINDNLQSDANARKSGYNTWISSEENQGLMNKYGIQQKITAENGDIYEWSGNNYIRTYVAERMGAEDLVKAGIMATVAGGLGAGFAPMIGGSLGLTSPAATGAIKGALGSTLGGALNGDLSAESIALGALTGGVGGSLSNADGMLGGFIDTGSNLADDAIKGAITGGIGGAIDGDVLGGALGGAASGAGMNLLQQGVGWAGDKISDIKDGLTGPGEFDFASDVVDFEGDDLDLDMQAADYLDSLEFVGPSANNAGYNPDTQIPIDDPRYDAQLDFDSDGVIDADDLQPIVPGGDYREGIQFSEMNNWVTESGQVVGRNDVVPDLENGGWKHQWTGEPVNEHANAITMNGQVVAYKDGDSWTDINGEPVTDPALVDFYTNQSTQSGDMQLIEEATHDTMTWDTGNGQESAYQTSDGKWHLTGSDGTVEIDPDTIGQVDYVMGEDGTVRNAATGAVVANQGPSGDWYSADGKIDSIDSFVSNGTNTAVRTEGTGNQILGFSDNHGGSDNPDFGGTIFGESYQDSTGNNYTATDGNGWGIDTGGTNYADPGATQDVYYNLDNGFYNPNATNNAETNFLPPEEIEEIVEQQQQQQEPSESDPVNNTDTNLDSGEVGGGNKGTPSNPVDTAVGSILANLEDEQLQAILSQNPSLAQNIADQIAELISQNTTDSTSDSQTDSSSESQQQESQTETQEETESETETGSEPTNNDPSPVEPNSTPSGSTASNIAQILAAAQAAAAASGGEVDGSTDASGDPNATPGGQNTNNTGDGGLDNETGAGANNDVGTGVQAGDVTGTAEDGTEGGNDEGGGDPDIGAGVSGLLAGLGAGAGMGGGGGNGPQFSPLNDYTRLPQWQKRRHQITMGLLQELMRRAG